MIEREAKRFQASRRHLDIDEIVRNALNHDTAHRVVIQHAIPDVVGGFFEVHGLDRAVDKNLCDLLVLVDLRDARFFSLLREDRDLIDGAADLVCQFVGVSTKIEVDDDAGLVLGRCGIDLADVFDAFDLFLDRLNDAFFDLFRRGARIGHHDGNRVGHGSWEKPNGQRGG